jgi:hypothetical protein
MIPRSQPVDEETAAHGISSPEDLRGAFFAHSPPENLLKIEGYRKI